MRPIPGQRKQKKNDPRLVGTQAVLDRTQQWGNKSGNLVSDRLRDVIFLTECNVVLRCPQAQTNDTISNLGLSCLIEQLKIH